MFRGWIGFSQWFRKEFGIYPSREMLVGLAKMGKEEREENTSFGAYLWEKKIVKEEIELVSLYFVLVERFS